MNDTSTIAAAATITVRSAKPAAFPVILQHSVRYAATPCPSNNRHLNILLNPGNHKISTAERFRTVNDFLLLQKNIVKEDHGSVHSDFGVESLPRLLFTLERAKESEEWKSDGIFKINVSKGRYYDI